MAFNMKTWVDRITEYPTRRRLRKEDGSDELVTVSREEGQVSEEGDAFSAENMNDLESRIDSAFKDVNNSLGNLNYLAGSTVAKYQSANQLGVEVDLSTRNIKQFISAIASVNYYPGFERIIQATDRVITDMRDPNRLVIYLYSDNNLYQEGDQLGVSWTTSFLK